MLGDRRFVITEMRRLAVRVTRLLCEREAEVVALVDADDELVALLPDAVKVMAGDGPWAERLRAIDLPGSDCLLVLAEDDLENLRVTTATDDVAPDVPVVLDRLDGFGIDATLSMSGTTAGAFVGAATDEHALRHIRVDDLEIVVAGPEDVVRGCRFG